MSDFYEELERQAARQHRRFMRQAHFGALILCAVWTGTILALAWSR